MDKVCKYMISSLSLLDRFGRIPFKIRGSQNKSVLLILLWNLVAFFVVTSLILHTSYHLNYCLLVCFAGCPIAGWLADVYFGRYRLIHYGMMFTWIGVILLNSYFIVDKYWHVPSLPSTILQVILTGIISIGLAGILANTMQFGIDQLIDASTTDITSYISWCVWLYHLAFGMAVISQKCYCSKFKCSLSFVPISCATTLLILSDCFLNHWFVKEPVTHNPLKLIYQVLRYAVKNKYPHLRSAFTYWEDKPYSRIDLGKAKYGGPFTTEQVEDVKTFFRIIALLASSTVLLGLVYGQGKIHSNLMYHYQDEAFVETCKLHSNSEYLRSCNERLVVEHLLRVIIVIIFVPVFEIVVYPLLVKCSCYANISIMLRFQIAMVILLLSELQILSIEAIATHNNHKNVTCLLYASAQDITSNHVLQLNYKWLIIPQSFFSFSGYLVASSGAEFIIAQSPYAMRGLLIGLTCFLYGASSALFDASLEAVTRLLKHNSEYEGNCGIWYFTTIALLAFLLLCVSTIAKRCYTPRRRDEDLHNQQIFAVNYFEKYLPSAT